MIINSSTKKYEVYIKQGFDFVDELLHGSNAFYVIDKNVYELYCNNLFSDIPEDRVFIMEASEEKKTIETALEICEIMTTITAKRNTHLVSFGGGIVQDITGFVSNILYRGIRWTFVPTTLLAACDSCIGGKTSLNYKHYKNLLGTFYPPDQIFICTGFFATLNDKDYQSGLGEVVKFNIMYGEEGLTRIEKSMPLLLKRNGDILERFVFNSLKFKKDFIEEDEFDKGIRVLLNFAHTFGHAFETVSNYDIPHGTAVALGMMAANRVSLQRGWLGESAVDRMEAVINEIVNIDLKKQITNVDDILSAMKKDKKQINSDLTAVLMYGDMKLKVVHDLTKEEVSKAIDYIFQYFNK